MGRARRTSTSVGTATVFAPSRRGGSTTRETISACIRQAKTEAGLIAAGPDYPNLRYLTVFERETGEAVIEMAENLNDALEQCKYAPEDLPPRYIIDLAAPHPDLAVHPVKTSEQGFWHYEMENMTVPFRRDRIAFAAEDARADERASIIAHTLWSPFKSQFDSVIEADDALYHVALKASLDWDALKLQPQTDIDEHLYEDDPRVIKLADSLHWKQLPLANDEETLLDLASIIVKTMDTLALDPSWRPY